MEGTAVIFGQIVQIADYSVLWLRCIHHSEYNIFLTCISKHVLLIHASLVDS